MKFVAKFEKVSFEQFKRDMSETFVNIPYSNIEVKEIYEKIQLPARATKFSAGYDFKSPINFNHYIN